MQFHVYILKSLKFNRWYIGSTGNLVDRIKRHNGGFSLSTKPFIPWILFYSEVFTTRSEACA